MRWRLTHLTLPLLVVHCSAPPHPTTFEGDGGANSTDTTSANVTTSGGGGSGAATGPGDGTAQTANTSSSTSQASVGGSASASVGTDSGGNGAGGTSTTAATVDSTSGSVGGNGATGGSATVGTGGNGGTGGMGGNGDTGGTGGDGGTGASGGMGGTGGASCTPTDEVCDGEDNDCNESVDEADVCPEGCVGASFEAHSYLICDRPRVGGPGSEARSWEQAMQYCLDRGLNLTLIESEDENTFIYKTLLRLEVSGDVWMGATDREDEGLWTWAAGEDPDDWIPFYDQFEEEPIDGAFNDWREGEPNDDGTEDCGIFEDLGGDEWAWDDRSCQTSFDVFVCESVD